MDGTAVTTSRTAGKGGEPPPGSGEEVAGRKPVRKSLGKGRRMCWQCMLPAKDLSADIVSL